MGFRIPTAVFQPRFPDSTNKNFPDSLTLGDTWPRCFPVGRDIWDTPWDACGNVYIILYIIHYYIIYYTVYIIADHCSLIHSCTKTHTEISKSNSKWNWYNNTTVCCHWQLTPSQLSLGQKALQLYSKPQFPTIPYHQLPRMIQEHTLVQLKLLYQDWVCNLITTKWLWQWDVSIPSIQIQ